jgi:hypothetical protein
MKSYSLTRKAVLGIVLLMMSSIQLFGAFENVELADYAFGVKTINGDAADVDLDGDLDFLTSQSYFSHLHFTRNDGSGLANYYLTNYANDGKFIDFDGDGYADIANVFNYGGVGQHGLQLRQNNGSGGFTHISTMSNTNLGTSLNNINSMAAADYDNDGDVDLVLAGSRWSQKLIVLENDGLGNFTEAYVGSWGNGQTNDANDVQFADFDGDLDLDIMLLAQSWDANNPLPMVWENTGTSFQPAYTEPAPGVGLYTRDASVADMDGDGDMDILAQGNNAVLIYENTGAFNFTSHMIYDLTGNNQAGVRAGDFDYDGDMDIVTTIGLEYNQRLMLLENSGNLSFAPGFEGSITTGTLATNISSIPWVGDAEGDGDLEVMTGEYYAGFLWGFNSPPPVVDPPSVATAFDVWDTSDPNNYVLIGQIDPIVTAQSGQLHYDYYSASAHPSGVNLGPNTSNMWMHENSNDGDLTFGFVFGSDASGAPANYSDINFRIIDSDTDPYVSQSDDPNEAVETPAGSDAFIGNFGYGNNTDGIAVSGISGSAWTIIVQSVDFGYLINQWYASNGLSPEYSDDITLVLGNEYRITPAGNPPSGAPVVVSNTAPTANAGGDQSEGCATGEVSFTLDGSGSSDLDGDVLSYSWTYAGVEVATSASFETGALGNMLVNGSFEDGTPGSGPPLPGWTNSGVSGYGGNSIDWGDWLGAANDGAWVIDLVGTGTPEQGMQPGSVEQTLSTEPGEEYVLTFDMKTNGSASLLVTVDGNSQTFSSSASYTSHSVAFTASSSATTIVLAADASWHYQSNNLFLDNVSVTLGGGSHTFVLTVSDGELTDSDEVAVSVGLDNEVPTIAAIDDISVDNDEGVCGAVVNFDVDASDDCELSSVVADPASGSVFAIGITEVTVTATDAVGNSTTTTFNVTVNDTEAPAITAPEAIASFNDAGECGAIVTFDVSASDNCDVSEFASSHASGSFFPVGITEVTVTATDAAGNTSETTFNVTVEDTEAPTLVAIADPITLWPPNHKYVSFDISDFVVSVGDNCTDLDLSSVVITEVSSDEEEDARGNGDGKTTNDISFNGDELNLRAERQGGGNGRVYTINLAVTDEHNNTSTTSCQVHVPHSRNSTAVDDGPAYVVSGPALGKLAGANEDAFAAAVIPEGFQLNQNYPNPFNPSTTISYGIPEDAMVSLIIYDVHGNVVKTLESGYQTAGWYHAVWNGDTEGGYVLSTGLYMARIVAGEHKQVIKMAYIK